MYQRQRRFSLFRCLITICGRWAERLRAAISHTTTNVRLRWMKGYFISFQFQHNINCNRILLVAQRKCFNFSIIFPLGRYLTDGKSCWEISLSKPYLDKSKVHLDIRRADGFGIHKEDSKDSNFPQKYKIKKNTTTQNWIYFSRFPNLASAPTHIHIVITLSSPTKEIPFWRMLLEDCYAV